jgi:hypothetical protein
VLLGFNGAVIAELEAVEGDIDQVFVQQQVLTLVVRKNDHEGLDEAVSQVGFHQLVIVGSDVLHINSLSIVDDDWRVILRLHTVALCEKLRHHSRLSAIEEVLLRATLTQVS